MPSITPNLWMDTQGLEAAEFYCSIFPNSKVNNVSYYGDAGPREAGTVLTVEYELDGKQFTIINGGPEFTLDEAVSFLITCKDQHEVDYYWDRLTDGGEESQCGWLKDRFGLSWQVVPEGFDKIMSDSDPARVKCAMQAVFQMRKLDLAALQAAADGT